MNYRKLFGIGCGIFYISIPIICPLTYSYLGNIVGIKYNSEPKVYNSHTENIIRKYDNYIGKPTTPFENELINSYGLSNVLLMTLPFSLFRPYYYLYGMGMTLSSPFLLLHHISTVKYNVK